MTFRDFRVTIRLMLSSATFVMIFKWQNAIISAPKNGNNDKV